MAEQEPRVGSVIEGRLWVIISGICMMLGAWWLQNQYETILRVQEQQAEYIRFADDKFISKEYLQQLQSTNERRLTRIEGKLDTVLETLAKDAARDAADHPNEMQR